MEEHKQQIQELTNTFDYLLVLDFEATCSDKEKYQVQEIIEFPIVIIDVKQNIILKEEFHTYIKPTVHPILSDFCKSLTHITQEQVDSAPILKDAIINADIFLKDQKILDKKFTFITCGDFDLGKCLRLEMKYKKQEYPDYFKSYINIKKQFPIEWYTESIKKWNKPPGMAAMLKALNLELIGQHHSGIDDSRNIAAIVSYMINKNIKFNDNMVQTIIEDKQQRRLNKKQQMKEMKQLKKQEKKQQIVQQNQENNNIVENNNNDDDDHDEQNDHENMN